MKADSSLRGRRVVVTRARRQAGATVAAFEAAGAVVELLPLIEVVEPRDTGRLERAAAEAGDYDWLVFTSANAVAAFLPRVAGRVRNLAVVGPATARAARQHGVEPRIVASRSDAEGLVAEMGPRLGEADCVLVPQADDARPALVEGLKTLGIRVVAVDAYSKRLPADAAEKARRLFGDREIGWVTFTSPRIVRHFAELFGESWAERRREVRALSIGPVTTRELRRRGIDGVYEASQPSPDAMVLAARRL